MKSNNYLFEILDDMVSLEEDDLSSSKFTATIGKVYKIVLSIAAIVCIGLSFVIAFVLDSIDVGIVFAVLGVIALFFLPTVFSYRCYVDNISIREEYLIIFIKKRKQADWQDIKYKIITKDRFGKVAGIKFLNGDMKKLLEFDNIIAGFGLIVQMAKRKRVREIKSKP